MSEVKMRNIIGSLEKEDKEAFQELQRLIVVLRKKSWVLRKRDMEDRITKEVYDAANMANYIMDHWIVPEPGDFKKGGVVSVLT